MCMFKMPVKILEDSWQLHFCPKEPFTGGGGGRERSLVTAFFHRCSSSVSFFMLSSEQSNHPRSISSCD